MLHEWNITMLQTAYIIYIMCEEYVEQKLWVRLVLLFKLLKGSAFTLKLQGRIPLSGCC